MIRRAKTPKNMYKKIIIWSALPFIIGLIVVVIGMTFLCIGANGEHGERYFNSKEALHQLVNICTAIVVANSIAIMYCLFGIKKSVGKHRLLPAVGLVISLMPVPPLLFTIFMAMDWFLY